MEVQQESSPHHKRGLINPRKPCRSEIEIKRGSLPPLIEFRKRFQLGSEPPAHVEFKALRLVFRDRFFLHTRLNRRKQPHEEKWHFDSGAGYSRAVLQPSPQKPLTTDGLIPTRLQLNIALSQVNFVNLFSIFRVWFDLFIEFSSKWSRWDVDLFSFMRQHRDLQFSSFIENLFSFKLQRFTVTE